MPATRFCGRPCTSLSRSPRSSWCGSPKRCGRTSSGSRSLSHARWSLTPRSGTARAGAGEQWKRANGDERSDMRGSRFLRRFAHAGTKSPGNIQTHHISARQAYAANMSRACRNLDAFGRPSGSRVWGHGAAVFGPNLQGYDCEEDCNCSGCYACSGDGCKRCGSAAPTARAGLSGRAGADRQNADWQEPGWKGPDRQGARPGRGALLTRSGISASSA